MLGKGLLGLLFWTTPTRAEIDAAAGKLSMSCDACKNAGYTFCRFTNLVGSAIRLDDPSFDADFLNVTLAARRDGKICGMTLDECHALKDEMPTGQRTILILDCPSIDPIRSECTVLSSRCGACGDVPGCDYCKFVDVNNEAVDLNILPNKYLEEMKNVTTTDLQKGQVCGIKHERCEELNFIMGLNGSVQTKCPAPQVSEECGILSEACDECTGVLSCGYCKFTDTLGRGIDLSGPEWHDELNRVEMKMRRVGEICGLEIERCIELSREVDAHKLSLTCDRQEDESDQKSSARSFILIPYIALILDLFFI